MRKPIATVISVPFSQAVADDLQKLLYKAFRSRYATVEIVVHPKGITLRDHVEYRYTQDTDTTE